MDKCDCAGDTVVLVVFGSFVEKLNSDFFGNLVVVVGGGLIVVLVKKFLKYLNGSSVVGMENGLC